MTRYPVYSDLTKLRVEDIRDPENLRFTVIDFETNGKWNDAVEVIEFAAVKVAGGEIDSNLASLCRASDPLSGFITNLTGITDSMIWDKPAFGEFLEGFLSYIGDDIVVAHNAPFDVGILLGYCRKAGIRYRPQVLDTVTNSRRLFPDFPNHKLGTLGEIMGLFDGDAHRALADSLATARLLLKMFEYCKTGTF